MPDSTFVYDDLERLRAVADGTDATAIYGYDRVGNMLSIIEFTPKSAPVGTSVTIHGTGFRATPSENTVTFAGIPATVISAAPTQILVSVPPGAASGPIAVTTPNGSATSSVPFTISAAAPLGFTGASPAVGTPGSDVTITGTGFDAVLANNTVIFNRTMAHLTSASGTTLEVEVPAGAGSGPITLITPFGTAVSGEDFFIPPAPRAEADVAFTGRVALGESQPAAIDSQGRIALVVFDGIRGQRVSVGVGEIDFDDGIGVIEVTIIGPHGAELTNKLVGRFGDDLDLGPLPESGTYTIVVDSGAAALSLVLTLSEPMTGTVAIGDPSLPVSLDKPGQDARLTFEGTAGQRVDLGVSEVSFAAGTGGLEVFILDPGGTKLASKVVSASGRGLHTEPLPDPGNYTIVVDPAEAKTVKLGLTLSQPLTGALAIEGAQVPITLRPGQNARLTFEGTAGQQVILGVSGVSFGTGNHAIISIFKPMGPRSPRPQWVRTEEMSTLALSRTLELTRSSSIPRGPLLTQEPPLPA
jgi:hypothetical protein